MASLPPGSTEPQRHHGYLKKKIPKKKGIFGGKKSQYVWVWVTLYSDLNRFEIYEQPKRSSRSKAPTSHLQPEPVDDFDPTEKGFNLVETVILATLSEVKEVRSHSSRFELIGLRNHVELEAATTESKTEWIRLLGRGMAMDSAYHHASDKQLDSGTTQQQQRSRKLSARTLLKLGRKGSKQLSENTIASEPAPEPSEEDDSLTGKLRKMEDKLRERANAKPKESERDNVSVQSSSLPREPSTSKAQIFDSQVFMSKARAFAEQASASLPRDKETAFEDVHTSRRYKSDTFTPIELERGSFLTSTSFDRDSPMGDGPFDLSSMSGRSGRRQMESFNEIPEHEEQSEPALLYVHRPRENTKLNQSSLERVGALRGKTGTKERNRRQRRRNSTSSVVPMGRGGPRSAVMPILAKSVIEPLKRKPKPAATMQMLKEVIQSSRRAGGNVLFEDLDRKSIAEIIDRMQGVHVKAGETVVKQGEKESNFFVVEQGIFNVYTLSAFVAMDGTGPRSRQKDLIAVKQPGSFFGEISLLYEQRGNVTVEAVTDGVLWSLSRQAFHEIQASSAVRQQLEKLRLITEIPLIVDNLSVQNIIALSDAMETVHLCDGEIILNAGDMLKKMYIVKEGEARIGVPKAKAKGDTELVFIDSLIVGETFGEWALLDYTAVSDVAIVANGDTVMLQLDVQEFDELIGPLREFVMKRWEETIAGQLPVHDEHPKSVKSSTRPKSKRISKKSSGKQTEKVTSSSGKVITNKPPPPPPSAAKKKLNLPENISTMRQANESGAGGTLRISSGFSFGDPLETSRLSEEGENVVAQALLDAKKRFSLKRGQSTKKLGTKSKFPLGSSGVTRDAYQSRATGKGNKKPSTIDDNFAETIAEMESVTFGGSGRETNGNLDKPWVDCKPLRPDISFSDLIPVAKLGRGHFGTVHLVLNKHKTPEESRNYDSKSMNRAKSKKKRQSRKQVKMVHEAFALKCLAREYIVSNGWQKLVENERAAMLELTQFSDSPFLLKLFNTYVDEKNVYFLFEVCRGGDLYAALKRQPEQRFTNEGAVKFYAGSAILGLSAMHERSIIFRDLKPENMLLDDDGFVKIGDFGLAKKSVRTFTVCGTPDYMAPETILSRGHDTAVDWWALGILIYELIFGVTPFFGDEPMDIYERVLQHEHEDDLEFPDRSQISDRGVSIIAKLLDPKRTRRLGNLRSGVAGVMFHPFFQRFNWDSLQNLRMDVPFAPDLCETSHFDNADEIVTDYSPNMYKTPDDKSGWDPQF